MRRNHRGSNFLAGNVDSVHRFRVVQCSDACATHNNCLAAS